LKVLFCLQHLKLVFGIVIVTFEELIQFFVENLFQVIF